MGEYIREKTAAQEEQRAAKIVDEVSQMLAEWEASGELASDFAKRLVFYFARHSDDVLQASKELQGASR